MPNSPTSINITIDSIAEVLVSDNLIRLTQDQWSEQLSNPLELKLAEYQIYDLKIYRTKDFDGYILCVRGYEPTADCVEYQYRQKNGLKKIAPIFALILIIFLFTALIAKDLRVMMSAEFLLVSPLFLGALVQYFSSLQQWNSFGKLLFQQLVLLLIIIMASLVILGEGIICVIIASPLLYLWQVIGAILMRVLVKYFWKPSAKIYSLSVVPLLLILVDPISTNTSYSTTKNEIVINAPVEQVFTAINNIQSIQEYEIKNSPIFWMGFPKPVSGMTVADGDGFTRKIHWQRNIYFEEKITRSEPNTLLGWTYRFTPESFPKGSLDDHVEIGGEYFDLAYTDYRLEKINEKQTKLILTIDYRLSTEINWYAQPWANFVLNEFSDVVLNVYKQRLENEKS